MALNIRWIKGVTLKILDRKLPMKTRFEYLLNLVLLLSMAFIIVSGILISRVVFPNLHIGDQQWFKMTHMSVSFLALAIVGVHVGLHWKWVMNMVKRLFVRSSNTPPRSVGVVLKLAMAAVLAVGVYEIYQTNFVQRLSSVTSVFGGSSSGQFGDGDRMEKGMFGGDRSFGDANAPGQTNADSAAGDAGASGQADTNGTNGNMSAPDQANTSGNDAGVSGSMRPQFEGKMPGGFKGHDEGGGWSAWNVVLTYMGIMGVFVIVVYYLSRLLSRKKASKVRQVPKEGTN